MAHCYQVCSYPSMSPFAEKALQSSRSSQSKSRRRHLWPSRNMLGSDLVTHNHFSSCASYRVRNGTVHRHKRPNINSMSRAVVNSVGANGFEPRPPLPKQARYRATRRNEKLIPEAGRPILTWRVALRESPTADVRKRERKSGGTAGGREKHRREFGGHGTDTSHYGPRSPPAVPLRFCSHLLCS